MDAISHTPRRSSRWSRDPVIDDGEAVVVYPTDRDIEIFKLLIRYRGFWSEVQRVYENRICTSLPSSLRIAWNGVLKPRHFLGVRLAVRMMSCISSSDTLSMSI